jgi:hypothetical protein
VSEEAGEPQTCGARGLRRGTPVPHIEDANTPVRVRKRASAYVAGLPVRAAIHCPKRVKEPCCGALRIEANASALLRRSVGGGDR